MATLYLVGEIGKEVTAKAVAEKLASVPTNEPLTVVLDSIGGSILEGQRIAELLERYPNRRVDIKRAYSIASWLALQFPKEARKVHNEASDEFFMIHMPVYAPDKGDTLTADEMKELAEQLEEAGDALADTYSRELGISKAEAMALMKAETYFRPEDQRKYQLMAVAHERKEQPKTDPKMSVIKDKLASLATSISNAFKAIEIELEPKEEEVVVPEGEDIEALKKALEAMKAERDQYKAMCDEMEAKMKAAEGEATEAISEMEAKFEAKLAEVKTSLESRLANSEKLVARAADKANKLPDTGAVATPELDAKAPTWMKQMHRAQARAKGVLVALAMTLLFAFGASAQTQWLQPRWGTASNGDNQVPGKYGGQIVFALAAGVDTINLNPTSQYTLVRRAASQTTASIALNDSVCFRIVAPGQRRWYIGDQITFSLLADGTARKVKFTGLINAPTTTVTASKWYHATLIYNGATWVPIAAPYVAP